MRLTHDRWFKGIDIHGDMLFFFPLAYDVANEEDDDYLCIVYDLKKDMTYIEKYQDAESCKDNWTYSEPSRGELRRLKKLFKGLSDIAY